MTRSDPSKDLHPLRLVLGPLRSSGPKALSKTSAPRTCGADWPGLQRTATNDSPLAKRNHDQQWAATLLDQAFELPEPDQEA